MNKYGSSIEHVKEYCHKKNIIFLDDWYKCGNEKHRVKCVICGNEWKSSFIQIKRSTGCPKCQLKRAVDSSRYTIEEINNILNKRGIYFIDNHYSNKNEYHNFKCTKCNHTFNAQLSTLLKNTNGHLCRLTKDDVEKLLLSKNILFLSSDFYSVNQKYDYKCLKCNNEWSTAFYHLYYSPTSGCPKCHRFGSVCEDITYKCLLDIFKDMKIIRQYKIKTYNRNINKCVTQFIDFYVEDIRLGIEYNGRQHYEPTFLYGKFISDINNQSERDIRKRQYCIDNNIKLIEIDGREFEKHTENLTIDRIKNILERNGIIV